MLLDRLHVKRNTFDDPEIVSQAYFISSRVAAAMRFVKQLMCCFVIQSLVTVSRTRVKIGRPFSSQVDSQGEFNFRLVFFQLPNVLALVTKKHDLKFSSGSQFDVVTTDPSSKDFIGGIVTDEQLTLDRVQIFQLATQRDPGLEAVVGFDEVMFRFNSPALTD